MSDIARLIQSTIGERSQFEVGIVSDIETHDAWGHVVICECPKFSGLPLRPSYLGGLYTPYARGDEVLILMQAGDRSTAVCIGKLPSARSQPSDEFSNDKVLIIHPGGTIVTAPGNESLVAPLVKNSIFSVLESIMTDLGTINAAIPTGISVPSPGLHTTTLNPVSASHETKDLTAS